MRILRNSARLLRRVINTLGIRTKHIGPKPKMGSPGNAPTEKTIRFGTRTAPSHDEEASPLRTRATYRLPHSVLLNSVPKSGTVLALKIIRSFIAPEDWLPSPWATMATIGQLSNVSKKSIVGHLLLTPAAYQWAQDKRHILLLRDPLEHCISYARFVCSQEMAGRCELGAFIRDKRSSPSFALRMIVLGWHLDGANHPGVHHQYSHIAAWAGLGVKVIFFKDLLKAVKTLDEPYWRELMSFASITLTDDWRERISAAAAPKASPSWSGNLEYSVDMDGFPSEDDMAYLHATCGDLRQQYQTLWEQFRSPAAKAMDARESEPPAERAA